MISSVSCTPTGSPAHSDSENESHLSAAAAASVGSAYSGGELRPTVVVKIGSYYETQTQALLSNNRSSAFRIFTVSEATLTDLNSGRNTLILQPVWDGNPEVATPEGVDKVIRAKRLFLRAYTPSDIRKVEIFHDDNPELRNALITRIVIADLDTEAEVKTHPDRVVELVSGKTWLRKNKAMECIVTRLSKTFDRHIDRSKYKAPTVFGMVEEQFRASCSEIQESLSPELIRKIAAGALQSAKEGQVRQIEEKRKQAEEARKQEAEEARIRERNKLADSLYWNAQKNAYYASQQASRQNGYYTPIPSNLSYATAKSVANDIAGMK